MNKTFVISALSIVSIGIGTGCTKEQSCISYRTVNVGPVVGPSAAKVDEEIELTVTYYLTNGCGEFEGLAASSRGNTTTLILSAKYQGCMCTDEVKTEQVPYKFKASKAGVYYLKFLRPNQGYLTDTITVY